MEGQNGNDHTAVNMDYIELKEIPKNMESIQSLKKITKLIEKSANEYSDIFHHLKEIKEQLEKDAINIFDADIKGKNIFHVLAAQPDQNFEILSVFGFDNKGNSEGLSKFVSTQRLEDLLRMQTHGGKKCCPIHVAVDFGFFPYVNALLKISPSLVLSKDGDGNTPLHIAAMSSMPGAVQCMEFILEISEEINQSAGDLLKVQNASGQNPIHVLCSNVPENRDALVAKKLQMMFACINDINILRSADNSGKTPLHLLCSKNKQSKNADRLNNVHDLMEILMEDEDGLNYPTTDNHLRTPLHLLTRSEFPNLVKLLITKPKTDLLIKDAHGKMAIHYAAERALHPKSQECVKVLADWTLVEKNLARGNQPSQDVFRNYLLWETFEEGEDENKREKGENKEKGTILSSASSGKSKLTALTSACKSKSTKTVEFILRNVYYAKNNFEAWFAREDQDENHEIFSLKQVYKNTPAALEFLFDKSIRIDLESSNEARVEFVSDISVITALAAPIQTEGSSSEMKYLGYARRWPEGLQEKLLLHPLTQCAVLAIWQNMLWFKVMWLVMNVIWLSAYWVLVPSDYSHESGFPKDEVLAAWILGVLCILWIMDEFLAGKVCIKRLISLELSGMMIWIQILLTVASVVRPCLQSLNLLEISPPVNIEKLSAAGGVLLSFALFWRNIGIIYLPCGKYVEYLIHTLKKILQAFICIAAVIIGFQRAFRQILPKQFPPTATWSFAKTLVMMTGEFEFTEMFEAYKNDDDDKSLGQNDTSINLQNNTRSDEEALIDFGTWNLLMFILFLIILPVAFYNLVTGVVVDKIANMERRLEMYQTRNQIRLINYMQQSVVSKLDFIYPCFKCLRPCFESLQLCFVSYRKSGDQGIVVEQKIKWFVEQSDELSFWSTLYHTFGELFKGLHNRPKEGENEVLSGIFLPKSLKTKLFEMYEQQLSVGESKLRLEQNNDDKYI